MIEEKYNEEYLLRLYIYGEMINAIRIEKLGWQSRSAETHLFKRFCECLAKFSSAQGLLNVKKP